MQPPGLTFGQLVIQQGLGKLVAGDGLCWVSAAGVIMRINSPYVFLSYQLGVWCKRDCW